MIELSLSALILAGALPHGCHTESHRVKRSGRLGSPEFLAGSASSRLWIGSVVQPAGWRRTAIDGSRSMPTIRAIGEPGQSTFLSLEEAGLIEMTDLDLHEKFLARLTVSSLNLLKEISKQEGVPIEDLNAGKLCDWFVKDREKRKTKLEEATLKWNTPEW